MYSPKTAWCVLLYLAKEGLNSNSFHVASDITGFTTVGPSIQFRMERTISTGDGWFGFHLSPFIFVSRTHFGVDSIPSSLHWNNLELVSHPGLNDRIVPYGLWLLCITIVLPSAFVIGSQWLLETLNNMLTTVLYIGSFNKMDNINGLVP